LLGPMRSWQIMPLSCHSRFRGNDNKGVLALFIKLWRGLVIGPKIFYDDLMKAIDIILALVCGSMVAFVAGDIFSGLGLYGALMLWILLPIISLLCLWLADYIGKKYEWVFQAAKHVLVGAFATVIDLKFFEFLAVGFLAIVFHQLVAKAVSFLFSTGIKYFGNKYWAFQKHNTEHAPKEVIQFFLITVIGLAIDIGVFYYATKLFGLQSAIPAATSIKLSVIIAAVGAAIWNFTGYKFIVFKK